MCTCQNARINNARQLRLHYPQTSERGERERGGEIRIWNANKNFEWKGSTAEAAAAATKGLRYQRTIRTLVACRQKARQGKRRRCHHSVHYCRLYCRSFPLPLPSPTHTLAIGLLLRLWLFWWRRRSFCSRAHCAPADASQRPSSLALALPLSARSFPFAVQTDACVLPKTPGQDRSKKRAKGAAVKPPTRQPTPSREREQARANISLNHQRWQNFVFHFSLFFFLKTDLCCMLPTSGGRCKPCVPLPWFSLLALSSGLDRHDRPV